MKTSVKKPQSTDAKKNARGKVKKLTSSTPKAKKVVQKHRSKNTALKAKISVKELTNSKKRAAEDESIREQPHQVFWQHYVKWVEAQNEIKDSKIELGKPWTENQVICVEDDDLESSLIEKLKPVIGKDYKDNKSSGFPSSNEVNKNKKVKQKFLPGIACLMLSLNTKNVLSFAPRLFDGLPVPKLFSKHAKVAKHAKYLHGLCFANKKLKKGQYTIIPSATALPQRVQRLIEDQKLSLAYTKYLCIDMSRDPKLNNFFNDYYSKTLFELLHNSFISPFLNEDEKEEYKIILVIPSENMMRKEYSSTSTPKEETNTDSATKINKVAEQLIKNNESKKNDADDSDSNESGEDEDAMDQSE